MQTYFNEQYVLNGQKSPVIDILWTRCNQSDNEIFTSNHFVPLFTAQGRDYVMQTQKRRFKQIEFSKQLKKQLETSNISTKKGCSVNFNLQTKLIDYYYYYYYYYTLHKISLNIQIPGLETPNLSIFMKCLRQILEIHEHKPKIL